MDGYMDKMEETDIQECLHRVAAKLRRSEWKFLAVRLGLSKADVDDIAKAHPGNFSRQKSEMLSLWKRNFREYATSEKLTRALREMVRDGGKGTETKPGSSEKASQPVPSPRMARYRTNIDRSPTGQRYGDFLSSTVQIRGLPLPMHGRDETVKHQWRSDTTSVLGHSGRFSRRDTKWMRAVSAPPPKHGKITIEVDIQSIAKPRSHDSALEGIKYKTSTNKDKIKSLPLTRQKVDDRETSDRAAALPKCPPVRHARKVRCNCVIHRRRDKEASESDEEDEEVGDDSKDPFDTLLESLRDPFFKRLIHNSAEIDTAVDQLERMKGIFVDETKLKCILFSCRCTDIVGLETLWNDHKNGDLAAMFQTSLVTDQSLASIGACAVTLETRICEAEYRRCQEVLSVVTGRKLRANTGRPKNLTSLVFETLFFKVCDERFDSSSECQTSTRSATREVRITE